MADPAGIATPAAIDAPTAVIAGAIVWAAALANAAWPTEAGFWVLRAVLTVLLPVWIIVLLRSRAPLIAISPLMIMAATALVGYSLVELMFGVLTGWEQTQHPPSLWTLAYVGSLGEALVLQFVAFCLLITALVSHLVPRQHIAPGGAGGDGAPWSGLAALAGGAILVVTAADLMFLAPQKGGLGRQLHDAVAPLTAFGFATMAHAAATRAKAATALFLGVATVYLGLRAAFDLVQTPIMIVGMTLLYFLIMRGRGLMVPLMVVAGAAGLAATVLFMIVIVRSPEVTDRSGAAKILTHAVYYKLGTRQGVSAYCLDRMVSAHRADSTTAQPFYFASALVPRVLWPEKPNLSLGHEYSVKYCDGDPRPESRHYELVTILAEPVVRGGWAGLAAAQGLLGLGLALIALALPGRGALGLIVLVGLSPWLVHFQQSFALYLANAVKSAIFIAPAGILLGLLLRARTRKPAP